jgi:hypothetical protein
MNTESMQYIIGGVPNEQLRHRLVKASELVASASQASTGIGAARFTLSIAARGPHPHFSFMHVSADPGQLLALCQRLKEVVGSHAGPIPVEAVRPGGRGAFVNMLYNDEDSRLWRLRSDINSMVTKIGIGLAPEQAGLLAELRKEQQGRQLPAAARKELNSLEKLGYKDLHATVTNVGTILSRKQREVLNRIIVPTGASADDFSGGLEAVTVYRLGEYGTAVGEPLAGIALAGQ